MQNDRSWWLQERTKLSSRLTLDPYNPQLYLQRAACYDKLSYPDLAASDAYRALVLTDELSDEEGEYHEQAVEAIEAARTVVDIQVAHGSAQSNAAEGIISENGVDKAEELWCSEVAKNYAFQSYKMLARLLSDCGDLKSAYDFTQRGLKAFPGQIDLESSQEQILAKYRQRQLQKRSSWDASTFNPREDLPANGSARREIYAWNEHEPDRFSEATLTYINKEITKNSSKCEVRVTELPLLDGDASYNALKPTTVKQLGIFATSHISPKEPVLLEPSVLTSSTRLYDPLCDACSSYLPSNIPDSPLPSCSSCQDIFFCSQACHDRAQSLYHPAICGITDFDIVAKDPTPFAATSALYTLLIARTMAMAETQGVHPLDLPQIKYLWGDYSHPSYPAERTLPFSFTNNIAQPLHLLARLDKDPFAPEVIDRYDTWVINTLLAKFRGTANAKMNERNGLPEVAGVHWLWSLANHDCAPNVRWEWEKGKMGFVARGGAEIIRWDEGRNGDTLEGKGEGGIPAGGEVLNHYCDVRLPVKERREWAVGALGGVCVCERCVWEASKEES